MPTPVCLSIGFQDWPTVALILIYQADLGTEHSRINRAQGCNKDTEDATHGTIKEAQIKQKRYNMPAITLST